MSDTQKHQHCTGRFIELANSLKDEGYDIKLISAALMTASGIYATYTAAGNEGGLNPSGVDKVVGFYRKSLENVQAIKKARAEQGAAKNSDG